MTHTPAKKTHLEPDIARELTRRAARASEVTFTHPHEGDAPYELPQWLVKGEKSPWVDKVVAPHPKSGIYRD